MNRALAIVRAVVSVARGGFGIGKALQPVLNQVGGWVSVIRESFPGAWQQNVTVDRTTALSFHAVFACITLIASDISKLDVRLIRLSKDGIWLEATNPAWSPVIRRPNGYQNRIQFWASWIISKLIWGNVYVLKARDGRGVVTEVHILDPLRVTPLVSDGGEVYYQLQADNLAGLGETVTVPASEVIHDRMNCLFHPLVGISPMYAAGLAATQGLNVQTNAAKFFGNAARPGGILTAPGKIDALAAARLKEAWEEKFSGDNTGKIAILGDGLNFQPMSVNPVDSQMVEQLRWPGEVVASVFHVPPYKVGLGPLPSYNNVQALNVEYFTQALQHLIEAGELAFDEGLGLPADYGIEFNIDGLLRMDAPSQMQVAKDGVAGGIFSPDEARRRFNLSPVPGGKFPYLQQQNYSLEALAARDAAGPPKAKGAATPATPPAPAANDDAAALEVQAARALLVLMKEFA